MMEPQTDALVLFEGHGGFGVQRSFPLCRP